MKKSKFPFVTILVPARNEAKTILQTLQHLDRQNYPKNRLQILVGNDNSEDETAKITAEFIQNRPHFRLISILPKDKKVEGKAGILAILANQAKGNFLFMTDADTCLPDTWIENMLQNFDEKTGIVTGFTIVNPTDFFAKMQTLDWLIGMGLIQFLARFGIPISSVGNNVAVRMEAYQKTGGYEKIKFSVTEDFALFQEIIKQNYGFKNLANPEILAFTKPEKSFSNLLQQRLRWAWGAVQIPFYFLPILGFYLLFGLILSVLFYLNWKIALGLWIFKMTFQYGLAGYCIQKMKQNYLWKYLIFYEIYHLIFNIILTGFYLFSKEMNWKGKIYQK